MFAYRGSLSDSSAATFASKAATFAVRASRAVMIRCRPQAACLCRDSFLAAAWVRIFGRADLAPTRVDTPVPFFPAWAALAAAGLVLRHEAASRPEACVRAIPFHLERWLEDIALLFL